MIKRLLSNLEASPLILNYHSSSGKEFGEASPKIVARGAKFTLAYMIQLGALFSGFEVAAGLELIPGHLGSLIRFQVGR